MDELLRLAITKKVINLLPPKLNTRVAKYLYNYDSKRVRGLNIAIDYLPEDGLKFYLNTKEFIGWNIFFHGFYEKETNQIIKKYIQPNDIVIEAGANNGSESVLIGKVLSKGKGKLYAFEPVKSIVKQLRVNVILNNLSESIEIFENTLGDKKDIIPFYVMEERESNQGMASKFMPDRVSKEVLIQQTTIDEFYREMKITRLDFLKMDVQGAEIEILNGAIEIINKYKPIIFTEASASEIKKSNFSLIDLWTKLKDLDYEVYLIRNLKLSLINLPKMVVDGNWLALRK